MMHILGTVNTPEAPVVCCLQQANGDALKIVTIIVYDDTGEAKLVNAKKLPVSLYGYDVIFLTRDPNLPIEEWEETDLPEGWVWIVELTEAVP